MKLIYKADIIGKAWTPYAETIEILEQRGEFVDHSFVLIGKNNNVQLFEVLIDEVSTSA